MYDTVASILVRLRLPLQIRHPSYSSYSDYYTEFGFTQYVFQLIAGFNEHINFDITVYSAWKILEGSQPIFNVN